MLFKLVDSGLLAEVNGCVSTGKESCVYHATGGRLVLSIKSPAVHVYMVKGYLYAHILFIERPILTDLHNFLTCTCILMYLYGSVAVIY